MQNHQRDSKACQARQAAAKAQEAKAAAAASTQQAKARRGQSVPDSRIGEAGGVQSHHTAAPATPAATREASSGSAFPVSTPPTPRGAATTAAEQHPGSGSDPTSASAIPSPSPRPSGYAQHFSSRGYGGFARPGTPALGFGLPGLPQPWQFPLGYWPSR
ncbi:unnamed protein product [Symbiodinium natans]|uniref:Uncharacterized protein n=1 Tax=Symbiodinium natans TaxID=878477 RepID=A0A812NHY5_9DINO|nr:unnamed protein product [Symbiodinium natans]